jgi:hypothetical protein
MFSGDFSVSQGVNPANFTLTDTSTGSDPNLTGRPVYLYLVDNSLLGGAPIDWPLSDGTTKAIDGLLSRDFSLNIVVTWQSSSPIPGSEYSKTRIVTFDGNSNLFTYSLLQQIASNQAITKDNDFMYNLSLVNSDILNAQRASEYGDQGSAQAALDRIYAFQVNQNYFF